MFFIVHKSNFSPFQDTEDVEGVQIFPQHQLVSL